MMQDEIYAIEDLRLVIVSDKLLAPRFEVLW
jgi:hypothetical protein